MIAIIAKWDAKFEGDVDNAKGDLSKADTVIYTQSNHKSAR